MRAVGIRVRTLLGCGAGRPAKHGLHAVEQVLRDQRLEVPTLRPDAVFGTSTMPA